MQKTDYKKISELPKEGLPPSIRQYIDIKLKKNDCVVLFQVGEFYEAYLDDALLLSKECEIFLTKRKLKAGTISMAGVPLKALDNYILKLLDKNYKVAVCRQIEDKENSYKRDVSRIYSKGTLFEDNFLDSDKNNFLGAFFQEKNKCAFAYCDISTGDFFVCEGSFVEILAEAESVMPSELLLPVRVRETKPFEVIKEPQLDIEGDFSRFNITLIKKSYFSNSFVAGKNLGYKCANAIISYILEAQGEHAPKFGEIKEYEITDYLLVNDVSAKSLELIKTLTNKNAGSFLWAVDKTKTSMGKRLLTEWIKKPLKNLEEIKLRQNAIAEFFEKPDSASVLNEMLSKCFDIKRLWGKLTNKTATPKDFLSLKETLFQSFEIIKIAKQFQNHLINFWREDFDILKDYAEVLEKTIDEKSVLNSEESVIREGANALLDATKRDIKNLEKEIKNYEIIQTELTGAKTLKVGHNKVFGYYIEVSNSNLKKVPDFYKPKQNLAGAVRYFTEELANFEEKINLLKIKRDALEEDILRNLKHYSLEIAPHILCLANSLATIDVLQSFYLLAAENGFIKPIFDDENTIELRKSAHPVGIKVCENFIPNDFACKKDNFKLLTGPNMAGKSTFLKQIALNIILAQTGSFVCAKSAKMYIFDKIFAQMGAQDELTKGNSTFMAEMLAVKNILSGATSKSLILFDELANGTSSQDGVALAIGICEYIIKNVGALTVFATHFHELTALKEKFSERVENLMIGEKFDFETGVFDRKVKKGFLDKSYGIKVAKMAGLPLEIIEHAEKFVV